MEVILIAAITMDGMIARHRLERISWSRDLSLFKDQTMGWPVIMGSNTKKTLTAELKGREAFVVHRNDDPAEMLKLISAEKCFVIGGSKTFTRFAPYLTHLYLTPHPYVFGIGIQLFENLEDELELSFQKIIPVDENQGIYQFQFRVKRDIRHTDQV